MMSVWSSMNGILSMKKKSISKNENVEGSHGAKTLAQIRPSARSEKS